MNETTVSIDDGPPDRDGQPIQIIELSNPQLTLRMLSLGATMWQLFPTDTGPHDSLCLFYADPADYLDNRPYLGAFVGPVANRIGGSSFVLDGQRQDLEPNEGRHHLHGGPNGWSTRQWRTTPLDHGVRFELHRPDGEDGYPGSLDLTTEWRLDGSTLTNVWTATSDRPTPVSPTNHAYWNLNGADPTRVSDVMGHRVEIPASEVVEVDHELIPTGELAPVGTLDARAPVSLGELVANNPPGVDSSYVLDGPRPIRLFGPNQRTLTISTSLPAVQLYTGQALQPADTGDRYGPYAGLCLETQYLPDALNHDEFTPPIVDPSAPLTHSTTWEFTL